MKLLRYAAGFCIGVVLACALYGCSAPAGADLRDIDKFAQQTRVLNDGRSVECLVLTSGYGYAITCDWDNAK
jgi:hypothetical protein